MLADRVSKWWKKEINHGLDLTSSNIRHFKNYARITPCAYMQ